MDAADAAGLSLYLPLDQISSQTGFLLRQIVDRPLYFGNQYPAGDDDVTHELLETFAAPGGPLLTLGGGDLTLTTPHHPIHDVYRDGEKYRQEDVALPMPAGVVGDFTEDH